MNSRLVYIDGRFYGKDEARVSVFDHGFLYGDGVFEGIRAYGGRVWKLDEHLLRLYESAKTLMLGIPLSLDGMREAVLETLRRNNLRDAYIRLVVSRGAGDLGLDPRRCPKPSVIIIADTISLFPEALYREGMKVVTVATRRNQNEALSPRIKSLNYLNSILAKLEANHLGYSEVLLMNSEGFITEGTGDNIFIVRKGLLLTPPNTSGILEGITRGVMLDIAREMGLPAYETNFTRHDLYTAEECFLTGTAAEAIPVVEVDGRTIGTGRPGSVTSALIAAFRAKAMSEGTEIYPGESEAGDTEDEMESEAEAESGTQPFGRKKRKAS